MNNDDVVISAIRKTIEEIDNSGKQYSWILYMLEKMEEEYDLKDFLSNMRTMIENKLIFGKD